MLWWATAARLRSRCSSTPTRSTTSWQPRSLIEAGVEIAIVKLGGEGVYVATAAGDAELVPPTPVQVVCGLGAGDAFGGALCDGLLGGLSAVDAVARASAAGAYVAAQLSCADAMPTVDQLNGFITTSRGPRHA